MEEQTSTPAGEPVVPQTEANPITNNNLAPEASQKASTVPTEPPKVNLHGFTEEQLADMRKFFDANGSFESVKSKISNPNPKTAEPTRTQQAQPVQSQSQPTQPVQPPKGFASVQELAVERYFKDLARDEKYAGIADKIENGDVLKEMASMGMNPIDENYNINVNQLRQFLDLKAASVPTKPTSVEPTNIPTVDYVEVGENITDMNQALTVMQQSMEAQARGAAPHPALAQAKEFLAKNWTKR